MKLIRNSLLAASAVIGISAIAQTTIPFSYTGSMQSYTVPPCVFQIDVILDGAQGSPGNPGGAGGLGGRVQGTLAVIPGDVLYIYVGGQNGFNGGGLFGPGGPNVSGSGGGASDIRMNGTSINDRVAVAGGGGGGCGAAQGSCSSGPSGIGGPGGGLNGSNGFAGGGCGAGGNGGGGGNQSVGGIGATGNSNCSATGGTGQVGGLGIGGNGGNGVIGCGGFTGSGGGGGGGGYFGGGGGGGGAGGSGGAWSGGGGGGGSSYLGTLTSATTTPGTRSGNGSVTLIIPPAGSPPASPAAIAGNASACENEIGLIYSISSVPLATSYTWTTPAGTVITSGQGTTSISVIAGSTSGQITVTADNSCGSSAPATFNLTINALPNITTSAAAGSICAGQSDTLFAFGGVSYVWNTGGTNATEIVTLTSSNTFTVTGTDNNGCTNTATVSVNVYALPTITATSSAGTICAGDADTLNAGGALTYAWSSGGNTNMEIVNPATTTTYTVTGTDVNGCSDNATVTVNVNQLPVVNLGNDVSSCATAVVLDAQNAGSTFMWSSGATAQTDTIATSGTYYVDVTDANGCSSSDTINVNINANPVIALGDDTTRCGGGVTLDAQIAGATYLWSDNSTAQTLTVTTSGTYFVTVTDANGCIGADTINVTINSIPTVTATASATTVCTDDANVTLTGSPAGGTWSGPGVTGNSFDPSVGIGAQTLTYSFTDANGCGDVAAVTINVSACTGINENNNALSVVVFPNPASEVVFVSSATTQAMNVVVYDIAGKQINVPTQLVRDGVVEINVQGLTNGTYFVSVEIGTNRTTQSVIIAR